MTDNRPPVGLQDLRYESGKGVSGSCLDERITSVVPFLFLKSFCPRCYKSLLIHMG